MDERQVLLDTFVAKVKQSAALCRGDRIQVENYAATLYGLTAGESGHFSAAAAGESLAIKVLTRVVDYCTGDARVGFVMASFGMPGNPGRELTNFLGQLLDEELPLALGDVPEATRRMICDEILVIALDMLRGKESNAAKLYESIHKEQRSEKFERFLDTHVPWLGKLMAEIVKSVSR